MLVSHYRLQLAGEVVVSVTKDGLTASNAAKLLGVSGRTMFRCLMAAPAHDYRLRGTLHGRHSKSGPTP